MNHLVGMGGIALGVCLIVEDGVDQNHLISSKLVVLFYTINEFLSLLGDEFGIKQERIKDKANVEAIFSVEWGKRVRLRCGII